MVKPRAALLLLALLPVLQVGAQGVVLPFFDDFSNRAGVLLPTLWEPSGARVGGGGNGEKPPTVGLLTFDALDSTLHLYPHANAEGFGADTATSRPIALGGYAAADSVVLSFFFLPGGGAGPMWARVGDPPEATDSLCVDFYSPSDHEWHTVWQCAGTLEDSLVQRTGNRWQYVALGIDEERWLHDGFRFRLRNRCSLETAAMSGMVGNCDMWHVDYVMLDTGRSLAAKPSFADVGFAAPATPLLAPYTAMPARQYAPSDMCTGLNPTIVNLDSVVLSSHYLYYIADSLGNELYRYDGGLENIAPYLPGEQYQTSAVHAAPPLDYALPTGNRPATYSVTHVVRLGVSDDAHPSNDTVRTLQPLADYYAYDDGTSENGFGITSTSATISLACRFDLRQADTLAGLMLYFNDTYLGANRAVPFRLAVWSSEGGRPSTRLYRDEQPRHIADDGVGRYARYELDYPLGVEGSIFVGLEQDNSNYINLGFDRSNNTSDRIYTQTASLWERSFLSGSLMLRPYFRVAPLLSADEPSEPMRVYPNPASTWLRLDLAPDLEVQLFDAQGRLCYSGRGAATLDVSQWAAGLYLLRTLGLKPTTHKIIVRH